MKTKTRMIVEFFVVFVIGFAGILFGWFIWGIFDDRFLLGLIWGIATMWIYIFIFCNPCNVSPTQKPKKTPKEKLNEHENIVGIGWIMSARRTGKPEEKPKEELPNSND